MKCQSTPKNYQELRKNIYLRQTDIRAIYRIIDSDEFKQVYEYSEEKEIAERLINDFNRHGLMKWMQDQIRKHKDYERYTTKDLRDLGKIYNIIDYNYLVKDILIERIRYYESDSKNGTTVT